MTAQIVFLAEWREHNARIEWTGDPLVYWRAWWDFCARVLP